MRTDRIDENLLSWGRFPRTPQRARAIEWRHEPLPPVPAGGFLPRGLGRSYGDVCLLTGGELLTTKGLCRFTGWNPQTGVIECEAGVSLADILAFAVPRGWFLPVTPGTRFVTVGGAIANDVHGKNHHTSGTFGCFVDSFELRRTAGTIVTCSAELNPELYRATIGGLGLTGLITRAAIRLRPIETPFIAVESVKFRGLDEFFTLSAESAARFEYTVAWLDCTARGGDFCRGIFMRGNHAPADRVGTRRFAVERRSVMMPFDAPRWALNRWSVAAFNTVYFNRRRGERWSEIVPYTPFFYPLDRVGRWNRMYGRRGFFQFQAVVPRSAGDAPLRSLMRTVVDSGRASFLAVLKEFGAVRSPGLLSFPRPGTTICLDFPNDGVETRSLLGRLEQVALEAGGALYPAKDATMSPASFRAGFPRWEEFSRSIDPGMRSDFWRRVTEG